MHLAIKYRLQVLLFTTLALIYFGKSVLKPYPLAGDEPSYLMDAISMGLFRSRQVRALYSDPDIVLSIYPSPILNPDITGDTNVTFHGVGLALFLIPAVFFSGKVIMAKLIVSLIAASAITVLFDLTKKLVQSRNQTSVFVVFVLLGTSAPIMFNANLLYPEYFCTLIFALVVSILFTNSQGRRIPTFSSMLTVSILISFTYWLNTRYIPLAIAAQISVLIFFFRRQKVLNSSKIRSLIWLQIVVYTANILVITLFFKSWYGTYNLFFVSQLQPSGLRIGDFAAIYRTIGTYLFGHTEGLLPWAPFLFAAVPGIALLWLKYKEQIFYVIAPAVVYFATIVQAAANGGSTPPVHYLAPIVPVLGIPLSFFILNHLDLLKSVSSQKFISGALSKKSDSYLVLIRNFFVVGLAVITITWSLLLSLSGVIRQGDIYIRSAAQEAPILPIARSGVSVWPHYLSPNKDNGSLGVPATSNWAKNSEGIWQIGLSQGFRSAGAYEAKISIKSNIESVSSLNFIIKERSGNGLSLLTQKTFEIQPNETVQATIPFQLYMTNEVAWFLESLQAQGLEITESDLLVIGPERPSGFSDLGYTILIFCFLTLLYLKEIKRQKLQA